MASPVIAAVAASVTPADSTSHVCVLPGAVAVGDVLLAVVVVEGERFNPVHLPHELGALEDAAAAMGWTWDASVSVLVDRLIVAIEVEGC